MSLRQSYKLRNHLNFDGLLYWTEGDKIPFCTKCYEKDKEELHLRYVGTGKYKTYPTWNCRVCQSVYRA